MEEATIIQFEKVQAQLESLHDEISILSKKSQNDALNKFKLKFVNSSLVSANALLQNGYQPFDDFLQFAEDEIPTNSDVIMIIGQYLTCLENFRADNISRRSNMEDFKFVGYDWYWTSTKIRTSPPKKIK